MPGLRSSSGLCLLLAGCGTLGGEGGGAVDLPNRGIVPYTEATLSYADPRPYRDPSALVIDGQVVLFAAVVTASVSQVVRMTSADGLVFGPAEVVLTDAGAPSAVHTDGVLHLVFTRADRIHYASDATGAFAERSAPLLDGAEPSLVVADDRFELYAVVGGHVVRATAGADLEFTAGPTVLLPGIACKDPAGDEEVCWDAAAVGSPEVRAAVSATGRPLLRMMYAGTAGSQSGLGFAASHDGVVFSRFAFNPIIDTEDVAESAPSNIRFGDRYLLYFMQDGVLTVSVNDAGGAGEVF